ncbi:hypothetical protein BH09VER1_BH09VER1_30180 [soil metagenome]
MRWAIICDAIDSVSQLSNLNLMKNLRYLLLGVFLVTAGGVQAQSILDKVKEGADRAVHATKKAVVTAADKVGSAVETGTEKVKEALKPDDEKEKTVTETTVTTSDPAPAPVTVTTAGVADPSLILTQVEKDLGRPLTPAEKNKYLLDLENAKFKARSAENDFAVQITEITGLDPVKSGEIVRGNGL